MDNCVVNCIPQLTCDILMESHIKNDGQKYINAQQAFLAFIWWPVKILINYFCLYFFHYQVGSAYVDLVSRL